MYMTRNESEITLGRSIEFESMIDELVAIQRKQPGYLGLTLLQSYGNPGRYTLTARWADREANRAAGRSEQFTAFARSVVNNGLFRPVRLAEAYESVFEVDADNMAPDTSTCEMWIDWTLKSPAVAPAFEAYSRQMSELTRQYAPGFVTSRLRRFLGNDTRYLVLAIVTDRAAARGRFLAPQVKSFLDQHPYTEFASQPPTSEAYYVIQRYVAATPALSQSTATAAR
jgi:quinol monooxygenase YgiN